MRKNHALISTVALLTAATALAGCATESSGEEAAETIKIGTLKGQPHLMHPYFYADVDSEYEYEIVLFDTSPDIKNAVVSGAVDAGIAGIPSAIAGVAAGQDVVLVAAAADGGSGIVGREGLTSLEDLAGLKVGYSKGSSQEILLRLSLSAAGLDPEADVELVNLPFADMAAALEAERIDAFSSAEIGPATALQNGAVTVASPYDTPIGAVNIGLYVSGKTIDEQPELVTDLVATHAAATDHMAANPDAWVTRLVDTFGVDRVIAEQAITNIWLTWQLDEEYLGQVGALIEQMHAHAQIDVAPAVTDLVNTDFVASLPLPDGDNE